jgi:hypothetical protein
MVVNYQPHVNGPIQDNALLIISALLQNNWTCTNPTLAAINAGSGFIVTDTRAAFTGLAVVTSRIQLMSLAMKLGLTNNYVDRIRVVGSTTDQTGVQAPNMRDEIMRILGANQATWPGGIQQIFLIGSVPQEDLTLTPGVHAEGVLVRLWYQGVPSSPGQPEPERSS